MHTAENPHISKGPGCHRRCRNREDELISEQKIDGELKFCGSEISHWM